MNLTHSLPLVNWSMGVIIIGVFAVVCIVMVWIVYSMANSGKENAKDSE